MGEDLGEKLKKLRGLKGYSQEFLADEVGVSLSTYQRYESSKSSVDIDVAVRLARFYNMTLDELYNFGDPNYIPSSTKELYTKRHKVVISVELDGQPESLDFWIKKLTSINQVL